MIPDPAATSPSARHSARASSGRSRSRARVPIDYRLAMTSRTDTPVRLAIIDCGFPLRIQSAPICGWGFDWLEQQPIFFYVEYACTVNDANDSSPAGLEAAPEVDVV